MTQVSDAALGFMKLVRSVSKVRRDGACFRKFHETISIVIGESILLLLLKLACQALLLISSVMLPIFFSLVMVLLTMLLLPLGLSVFTITGCWKNVKNDIKIAVERCGCDAAPRGHNVPAALSLGAVVALAVGWMLL